MITSFPDFLQNCKESLSLVHCGGGGTQVEEAGEGKLRRMWGDSDGIVLEGAYGEAAWKNCTTEEGGEYWRAGELVLRNL